MDWTWSAEQRALRNTYAQLGAELNDGLVARDAAGELDRGAWDRCARAGVLGLPIPVEHGGGGRDPLTTVGALERLGYGCRDNGLLLSINAHLWTAAMPLVAFGTDAQKARYLPGLAGGTLIGANAITEPEAGSDAFAMRTLAVRRGDRYVLRGAKSYVTNGPVAGLIVVFATSDVGKGAEAIDAFLVEPDFPGFRVGPSVDKMGLRTSPMSSVLFEDCEVPAENRLGREGGGAAVFTHAMTCERGAILASAVGSMERLLELSIARARSRRQFGQPIGKQQLVATKIVDMKLRLETSRALLYRAAWERAQGKSAFLEAALAKLHASECWVRSAEDALQVHGAEGYTRELGIERELRDAIGSRLYSGTSEVQRQLIATLLGL